jgi:hypothetical protein
MKREVFRWKYDDNLPEVESNIPTEEFFGYLRGIPKGDSINQFFP